MSPTTGLGCPYGLRHDVIDSVITRKSPGVYVLGYLNHKRAFVVCYVGRSDVDVAARLKTHVNSVYSRFKFKYFDSPKAAFEKECVIWHDFGGPEGLLDNKNHPDKPEGTNWKCPICSIFD